MYLTKNDKGVITQFLTEHFISIHPEPAEEYVRSLPNRCYVTISAGNNGFGTVSAPKFRDDMSEEDYKRIVADCFLEQASDVELKTVFKEAYRYSDYIEEQIEAAKSQVNVM